MSLARGPLRRGVDLAMGCGLVGTLLLISGYEARRSNQIASRPGDATAVDGRPVDAGGPEPGPAPPVITTATRIEPVASERMVKIALTRPQFDDMGALLDRMGAGYSSRVVFDWPDLADPAGLDPFDVLFLTCSDAVTKEHPNLKEVLRRFVLSGKTLYASDLWYPVIGAAFPEAEAVDMSRIDLGGSQAVDVEVAEPSMREALGSRLRLQFDKPNWVPARFEGSRVVPLLRGSYATVLGKRREAPLLVKFPVGQGTVIFTSFHNEHQMAEDEIKLLKNLVVIVATARLERELRETIVEGGLSPRKGSLLTASRGGEPVSASYTNRRRGRLKFILGFEQGAGARLKLTVRGPDGPVREEEGSGRVEIDIADASDGEWSYTISTIAVPYDNFGYRLIIAE